MTPQDRISRLAQQIGDRLQNASQAPEDIQKGVQQVVRGAFDRLELVSREDFDILMDVLQRTRARRGAGASGSQPGSHGGSSQRRTGHAHGSRSTTSPRRACRARQTHPRQARLRQRWVALDRHPARLSA